MKCGYKINLKNPKTYNEKLLDDGTERLRAYKVYCFNGIPRYIGVDSGDDSKGTHYKDIYDTEWNLIEGYEMVYPNSGGT